MGQYDCKKCLPGKASHRRSFYLSVFLFLLSMTGFLLAGHAVSADSSQQRVLFISSYSYAWETVPEQIQGIQSALAPNVQLDYKFMDTKNINTKKSQKLFYRSMKLYLSSVPQYDGIIVGDDDAFQFALDHREELFPDIPIAFEAVNNLELAQKAALDPCISGVIESLSYDNTIRLTTQLYPDARHLVAVLDDTITGISERKKFYNCQKDYPQLDFQEINTSQLTEAEIKARLQALKKDSILLYIMCSENADKHNYIGHEGIQLVSRNASIPTFSVVSIGLGHGVLGGEIVSQEQMGAIAGEMIQKHLNGDDFSKISMQTKSPRTFAFDENVMRRFSLSASQLPNGATIINHEKTFMEKYQEVIRIGIQIVLLFVLFLLLLLLDNLRGRRLNHQLNTVQRSLKQAARYDHLTSLPNRTVFMETIQQKEEDQEEFSLVLFDIDHFKSINDTLGHNNGDIVLREMAHRIIKQCDAYFQVYRLGGDEFTALIDSTDISIICHYVEKIQHSFDAPFCLNGEERDVHCSIGIALFPKDGKTITELIAAADDAMYDVKKNGRNGLQFYHPSLHIDKSNADDTPSRR